MVSGFWCSIAICNDGSVYSTGTGTAYGEYGQNGLGAKGVHNRSWKRIEGLKDIVDCDFGSSFVVFLSSSGRVFSAGLNHRGQLGLDTKEDKHIMRDPTEITYFRENDIAIQSVRCCSTGVVALDCNGNVYQWGVSLTGGSDQLCPQKIKLEEKVVSIETGHDHCICRTEKGHFVSIGNGDYGECCRDNVDDKSPQNINAWILRQIKAKETKILSVIPGANCTVILVSSMDARTKNKHPLARVQSVEATPEQKQATDDESANEIGDFLSELGLGRYLSAFRDEGFETMDELQEINESQLKEIGLKMAHRLKLLKKIRAFFTAKSYDASSTKHKEERKEDDEDVRKDNITRSNGLIICVGIAEYDELDNLETAADIEMYRALFEDKYHYKVIANDPSKRMTKKDLKRFLLNVRKDHLYDFDDYKLYYDALVVTFGGHGTYDSIICSDGSRCKHKELRNIFLIDELMEIPKIFLIDACRMDDDCDVPTQKARNAPTASTFSTTLMACEGNAVYGAQICRFITEGLSESYDNNKYTDFRTVYIAAKKRIKQATQADQDLQLCEHDTDIESVVFKPNRAYSRSYSQRQRRGTNAKRYCGDTKQTSTVDFTRKFLKKIGMERHYDAFEAKGVLDEASLKDVNKGTLIWLGIRNESSQKAILNAIKNLK